MQPTELSNGTTKAFKRTIERLTISASVLVFINQSIITHTSFIWGLAFPLRKITLKACIISTCNLDKGIYSIKINIFKSGSNIIISLHLGSYFIFLIAEFITQ